MNLIRLALILFLGITLVGSGLWGAYRSKGLPNKKKWLTIAGYIFLSFGAGAFFCVAACGLGGGRWLSGKYEWPVGTGRAVKTTEGDYVVGIKDAARIQIYDASRKFLNGWWVNSGGGNFTYRVINGDKVEIFITGRHIRYVYNLNGVLLEEEKYTPSKYPDTWFPTETVKIPTPWWWWPLTSPFHGMIILTTGAMLVAFPRFMNMKSITIR